MEEFGLLGGTSLAPPLGSINGDFLMDRGASVFEGNTKQIHENKYHGCFSMSVTDPASLIRKQPIKMMDQEKNYWND